MFVVCCLLVAAHRASILVCCLLFGAKCFLFDAVLFNRFLDVRCSFFALLIGVRWYRCSFLAVASCLLVVGIRVMCVVWCCLLCVADCCFCLSIVVCCYSFAVCGLLVVVCC